MRNHWPSIFSGILVAAVVSQAMWAHHGQAPYQAGRITTLKGTVTEFQFVNPHALIRFEVRGENGKVEKWTAEIAPPAMLNRVGWEKNTLQPGDTIVVRGNVAKDGSRVVSVRKITLPNGQELNQAPK